MINVKNEAERLPHAVKYCQKIIDDLETDIKQCDYTEDVDGKLVYAPGSYEYEKRELANEQRKWVVMLNLLTHQTPFTMLDR